MSTASQHVFIAPSQPQYTLLKVAPSAATASVVAPPPVTVTAAPTFGAAPIFAPVAAAPTAAAAPQSDFGLHSWHNFQDKANYVDPQLWCITRENLREFEQMVKDALAAGRITPDPDPNRKDPGFKDANIGPNIHNVCRCLIKPETKEAGGMSWALWKNPGGNMCDVFASHSWNEGVFEFINKVKRVWPRNTRNMYICFLSNPQNGDINAMLKGVPLQNVPFARALETAKYMLVIPNKKESIYTRLWCVFELYLALKAIKDQGRDLMVRLPWISTHRAVAMKTLPAMLLIPTPAAMLGYYVLGAHIGVVFGPLMWLLVTFSFTSFVSTIMRWITDLAVHQKWCRRRTTTNIMIAWEYIELFVVGLGGGLGYWHLLGEEGDIAKRTHLKKASRFFGEEAITEMQWEPGEEVPITLLLFFMVTFYLFKIFLVLVRDVVSREGHELQNEFTHVKDALCTDDGDKTNIFHFIKGKEEEIDHLIDELKLVGRYDYKVAFMLRRGMHPTIVRDGINPFKLCCGVVSFEFWWITDLMARNMVYEAAFIPIISLTLMVMIIYLPSSLKRCAPKSDDRFIWGVNCFLYFGVGFAIISNHPKFFNDESLNKLDMSRATSRLQMIFVLGMLLTDAWFYCGCYKYLHDGCMNCYHSMLQRLGLSHFFHEWDLWNCCEPDSEDESSDDDYAEA